jgi:hypothetical protein
MFQNKCAILTGGQDGLFDSFVRFDQGRVAADRKTW